MYTILLITIIVGTSSTHQNIVIVEQIVKIIIEIGMNMLIVCRSGQMIHHHARGASRL